MIPGGCFDLDSSQKEIVKIEAEMSRPDFWSDSEHARKISKQREEIAKELEQWTALKDEVYGLKEIAQGGLPSPQPSHALTPTLSQGERGIETGKGGLLARPSPCGRGEGEGQEWEDELKKEYGRIKERFEELEFFILFSGKYDKSDVILAIHAGTGGTEAQDWAEMLLRMYTRFCERHGFAVRVLSQSRGTEAGIKSIVLEVSGRYAYGWLKSERGVHRLVRISPFDAEKMRHTSFALAEVLPILEEVSVEIDPKDLRVDTYLSSGHGGQSVQTTYSAVRIVHIPTGITVTCQNERSQQQNRETAMKILRSKLHALAEEAQTTELKAVRGEYKEAAWGNQIRSYVLHPYHMVKDLRTKHETSDTDAVLDGKLEEFVESYLRGERGKAAAGIGNAPLGTRSV